MCENKRVAEVGIMENHENHCVRKFSLKMIFMYAFDRKIRDSF